MSRAFKAECKVATTTNISLSGEQTINGVAVVQGDRVLVRTQSDAIQNGIYVVSQGLWGRAPDFSKPVDTHYGCYVGCAQPAADATMYMLSTPRPWLFDVTELTFKNIGDQDTGGGGGGPGGGSTAPLLRVVYVDPQTTVAPLDQTGSETNPYDSIQDALAHFNGFTGGQPCTILLAPGVNYSGDVSFNIVDKPILLAAAGGGTFRMSGSHSVILGDSGNSKFWVRGLRATSSCTFTVHDGLTPATSNSAYLHFENCDGFSVAQNPGDTSSYNLWITADSNPVDTFAPMRFSCFGAYATGSLFTRSVTLGDATSGTFRGNGVQLFETVIRNAATIQSANTQISMGRTRFASNATITFTGAAGTLDLDGKTRSSYHTAAGTRTLNNGTLGTSDYATHIVPDGANYSDGDFRYDGPDANGVTSHDNVKVRTGRLATLAIQTQRSPRLGYYGHAWDTNDAVSREVMMGMQIRPIAGNTVSAVLAFMFGIDGTVSDANLAFSSDGRILSGTSPSTIGALGGSNTSSVNWYVGSKTTPGAVSFGVLGIDSTNRGILQGGESGRGFWIGDANNQTLYADGTQTLVQIPSVGAADVLGFLTRTGAAATVGAQVQRSPVLAVEGQGWDTDNAVSQTVHFGLQVRPIPGTTVSGTMHFMYGIGTSYATTGLSLTSSGHFQFTNGSFTGDLGIDASGSVSLLGGGVGAAPGGGVYIGDRSTLVGGSSSTYPVYAYCDSNDFTVHVSNGGTPTRINRATGVITEEVATAGVPVQYGPSWMSIGFAWDGSQARAVEMGWQTVPIAGVSPTGLLRLVRSISGVAAATGLAVSTDGKLYFGNIAPSVNYDAILNVPYSNPIIVATRQDGINADTQLAFVSISGDHNWLSVGNSNTKTRLGSSTIRLGALAPDSTALEIQVANITNGPGANFLFDGTRARMRADGHTSGTNLAGLPFRIAGGPRTGTGAKGGFELGLSPDTTDANFEYMAEGAEVANGRRVLALLGLTAANTTKLPTNTGDGVIHIAAAQTEPTAAPGSGCLMWIKPSNGHLMAWPAGAGAPTDLTP